MSYNPMVDEDVEILENELWSKQYQKVCKVLQEDSVLTKKKPGKGVQKFFFTWPGRSHERSEQICDQINNKVFAKFYNKMLGWNVLDLNSVAMVLLSLASQQL